MQLSMNIHLIFGYRDLILSDNIVCTTIYASPVKL